MSREPYRRRSPRVKHRSTVGVPTGTPAECGGVASEMPASGRAPSRGFGGNEDSADLHSTRCIEARGQAHWKLFSQPTTVDPKIELA